MQIIHIRYCVRKVNVDSTFLESPHSVYFEIAGEDIFHEAIEADWWDGLWIQLVGGWAEAIRLLNGTTILLICTPSKFTGLRIRKQMH